MIIKRLSTREWYPERDLNPHSCNSQGILSPSCLPIPPSGQPRLLCPIGKNVRQRALSGAKLMINYVFCKFSAIFTIFFAIERVRVVIALLIALLFQEHRSLGALHTPALRARRDRYRIGPRLRACISTYKATMGTAHDRSRRCFRSHNS